METKEMRLESLRAEVEKLARYREDFQHWDETVERAYKQFQRDHAGKFDVRDSKKTAVKEQEKLVRALAEAIYDFDQDTKPVPGITLKAKTVVAYNGEKALAWILENNHTNLLDFKRNEFEKAALALRPDFVQFDDVHAATIARDLSHLYPLQEEVTSNDQPSDDDKLPF